MQNINKCSNIRHQSQHESRSELILLQLYMLKQNRVIEAKDGSWFNQTKMDWTVKSGCGIQEWCQVVGGEGFKVGGINDVSWKKIHLD